MKKRIIALFICAISAFSVLILSACSESCISCLFKPKTPTVKSVTEKVKEFCGIDLPKNITLINYALNPGLNDGFCYYVFNYDGNDETFNALLSSEKSEEFEQNFSRFTNVVEDYFIKEYTFPDLSGDYLWTLRIGNHSHGDTPASYLFVMYFQAEQQLIVYEVIL